MPAKQFHAPREFRIVGGHHAALTRRQNLVAEQAEAGNRTEAADAFPVHGRTMRFRGIFHEPQVVPLRDLRERGHVAGHAVEMHGHDPDRAFRDCRFDGRRIHVPGIGRAVDEDRHSSAVVHRIRRRDIRERRHDDLLSRLQIERHQREVKGRRAVARGQRMRRPGELGKSALELLEVWSL